MNKVKGILLRTELTTQIVSIADAKKHAVIEHSYDDIYVASLCKTAQRRIQAITRRQLLTANYSAYLDQFPPPYGNSNDKIFDSYFELPYGGCIPILTTVPGNFGPGIVVITPASMDGIVVGTLLTISQVGNPDEIVTVTAVTSTTFTAYFTNTYLPNTITTTIPLAIAAGQQTVTPVSMQGIQVGSILTLVNGGVSEIILVIGTTATNFSAQFNNSYPTGTTVTQNVLPIQVTRQSVSYVKYFDTLEKLQVLNPSIYKVDYISEPTRIWLDYLHYWPYTYPKPMTIEVNWTCGYPNVAAIPEELTQAIKQLVAEWYNKREDTDAVKRIPVPNGVMAMCDDYKIHSWGY